MSKFGKKFNCWSCGTKFYDLNKPSPKCPKCGKSPEDDPNKGMIVLAPIAATDDFGDEASEPIEEEALEDDEAEDGIEDVAEEPDADDY